MIAWLLTTRAGRAVAGALTALGLFLGIIAHQRRDAARDATQRLREKDQENADAIRDRVQRERAGKLREYESRGFRDGE